VEKADGEYAAAIASLNAAAAQYPRDRVVQNQLARIHFLNRNYKGAVEHARKVLGVDPEDVQAHYTLMLAYRGLGDNAAAAREQALFARFKADESAQAITQTRRLASPEDNNERQMIHDHGSGIGGETRTGAKITRALPGVRAGRVRTGD
jgi:tetratricopeptide (TPR) repeat protein